MFPEICQENYPSQIQPVPEAPLTFKGGKRGRGPAEDDADGERLYERQSKRTRDGKYLPGRIAQDTVWRKRGADRDELGSILLSRRIVPMVVAQTAEFSIKQSTQLRRRLSTCRASTAVESVKSDRGPRPVQSHASVNHHSPKTSFSTTSSCIGCRSIGQPNAFFTTLYRKPWVSTVTDSLTVMRSVLRRSRSSMQIDRRGSVSSGSIALLFMGIRDIKLSPGKGERFPLSHTNSSRRVHLSNMGERLPTQSSMRF